MNKGADINVRDSSGWTPLMKVAYDGRLAIVKVLLSRGVDVNLQET